MSATWSSSTVTTMPFCFCSAFCCLGEDFFLLIPVAPPTRYVKYRHYTGIKARRARMNCNISLRRLHEARADIENVPGNRLDILQQCVPEGVAGASGGL